MSPSFWWDPNPSIESIWLETKIEILTDMSVYFYSSWLHVSFCPFWIVLPFFKLTSISNIWNIQTIQALKWYPYSHHPVFTKCYCFTLFAPNCSHLWRNKMLQRLSVPTAVLPLASWYFFKENTSVTLMFTLKKWHYLRTVKDLRDHIF